MIKLFIKIVATLEFLIFTTTFAFLWIFNEFNKQVGFTLAHITGFITFIILGGILIYVWRNRKATTAWNFIFNILSLILMMIGYFLFVFEGLSPFIHAGASLNFDLATSGITLSNAYHISKIKELNQC
jgi:hypothetical protein